ncbi:unnamed protein product [Parnassius mnemosyne]|uniref:unspecific monooxygenase n=1 Tax=Parnassius mnemosyne TaxID=213953 RepID=A0AAV1KEV8_9NEOP
MFLILILFIVLCFALWIYTRWNHVKHYWAKRGVPYLPPHLILGSLTFLQRQNTGLWMREMYDRFKSPYVGVWLFWRPALIINCPEIARRVLIKDAAIFRDRLLSSGKGDPIGGLNLFTVNDPLWSLLRRRLTSVFTAAKLKNVHGLVTLKTKELVQRIGMEMDKNKCVNLRMVLSDYTTDIIGTTAFGIASDATLTSEGPLRVITKEFSTFNLYRGLNWCCIFFIPELVDILGFSFFPKHATKYFRKIFCSIVDQRGGYDAEIRESKDLLDALRKMKQDCKKENEDISEDTLIAQAAIFLLGGFDTTASALSYCLYEIAFVPEIQEKLYKELKDAERNSGNTEFNAKLLSELVYLNCVIKETLRKYAPMGWLDRIASKDYQIDENLTITAGTPIYVNGIGMHYDPEFFPKPEIFDPDRFLPENEKQINAMCYLPFGEGPRHCIGRRFAEQNLRSALAAIVFNFELRPKPNAPLPSETEPEKKGMFLMPGQHLYLEFIPRHALNQ